MFSILPFLSCALFFLFILSPRSDHLFAFSIAFRAHFFSILMFVRRSSILALSFHLVYGRKSFYIRPWLAASSHSRSLRRTEGAHLRRINLLFLLLPFFPRARRSLAGDRKRLR